MQLFFGLTEQVFGLGAMASHVVMVRSARVFHLVDRFLNVVMNLVKIVPVFTGAAKASPAVSTEPAAMASNAFFIN